jgi:hypothetical protein
MDTVWTVWGKRFLTLDFAHLYCSETGPAISFSEIRKALDSEGKEGMGDQSSPELMGGIQGSHRPNWGCLGSELPELWKSRGILGRAVPPSPPDLGCTTGA